MAVGKENLKIAALQHCITFLYVAVFHRLLVKELSLLVSEWPRTDEGFHPTSLVSIHLQPMNVLYIETKQICTL